MKKMIIITVFMTLLVGCSVNYQSEIQGEWIVDSVEYDEALLKNKELNNERTGQLLYTDMIFSESSEVTFDQDKIFFYGIQLPYTLEDNVINIMDRAPFEIEITDEKLMLLTDDITITLKYMQ